MADTKKVTVVPKLQVTSGETTEEIIGFCAAWQRGRELPTPVSIHFDEFVRPEK